MWQRSRRVLGLFKRRGTSITLSPKPMEASTPEISLPEIMSLGHRRHRSMELHRVVIIGELGVGKSSIVAQFMGNDFMDYYDPTWEPDFRKQVSVDGVAALIECLDISYTEYTAMQELWFKDADACMFVYSVSSRSSFECLYPIYQHWAEVKGQDCGPMILVGNKCDQEDREVSEAEGMELAKAFDSKFVEMSRFKSLSAEKAFFTLVREVRAHRAERKLLEEIQAAAYEPPPRSGRRDQMKLHRTS